MRSLRVPTANHSFRTTVTFVVLMTVAICLRFVDLSAMEFKGDEFTALRMAMENVRDPLVTKGLTSSVGIPNPPGFIYVISLPVLFSANPIFVTAFVGLMNVIGMGLLWLLLRRYFSLSIAWWSTLLYASTPWAILYSRKLWAQNLLPPFVIGMVFLFWSALEQPKTWKTVLLALCASMLVQLHMSAWFFMTAALPVAFLAAGLRFDWRQCALGWLIACITFLPFIYELLQGDVSMLSGAARHLSRADSLAHLRWMMNLSSGGGLGYLLGDAGEAEVFAMFPGVAILRIGWFSVSVTALCIAVYWVARRLLQARGCVWRMPLPDRLCVSAVLVLVGFHLLYALAGVQPLPHYHTVLYPFLAVMTVYVLYGVSKYLPQSMHVKASSGIAGILFLVVCCNLLLTVNALRFVRENASNMEGDYGRPYFLESEQWLEKLGLSEGHS